MISTEDLMTKIGRLSVFFSTWDLLVTLVLLRLCPETHRLRENETLGQKLTRLEKLQTSSVTNPEILAGLQATIAQAQKVAVERNRFLHDQIVFNLDMLRTGKLERVRIRQTKEGKITFEKV